MRSFLDTEGALQFFDQSARRLREVRNEEIKEEANDERDKAQRKIDLIDSGLKAGMTDLATAIKTYLKSAKVRKLLNDLENWADGEKVLSPKEMKRLASVLLKILMARSGNRPQVYGAAFTRAHFATAGEAANPYGERHLVDGGASVYVRRNPHGPDALNKDDLTASIL